MIEFVREKRLKVEKPAGYLEFNVTLRRFRPIITEVI